MVLMVLVVDSSMAERVDSEKNSVAKLCSSSGVFVCVFYCSLFRVFVSYKTTLVYQTT